MRLSNQQLGVYVPGLREFVPASWTIPENPFFPGMAGLRDFVPASFSLPPQPAGIGAFVPATFTLPPQPAGVGDFVGTTYMYPIPQNSVLAALAAGGQVDYSGGLGGLHGDCGCGCGGHCSGGLGQASTDFSNVFSNAVSGNWEASWTSFLSFLSDPFLGTSVPIWMVGGAGLLAYALLFSGGEGHSRYSRAKRAYSAGRRAYS